MAKKTKRKKSRKKKIASNQAVLNEAELEARIAHAVRQALPFLKADDIRHQLRFTIRLGHQLIEVDGKAALATGRCDILLVKDDRPLAIMELKRPDLALSEDDRAQGVSYARVVEPWAPLVVVTNGTDTRFFSTFTGAAWEPDDPSEQALAKLFDTSASLAEADLRNAVETLLGPGPSVWMPLVRAITDDTLGDLTGEWDDPLRPFAKGLLFPRKATSEIAHRLHRGACAVIVAGTPLSGKSNVLRELALRLNREDDHAVLMLDASSARHGILQTVANVMTQSFGWSVSTDNVRSWLLKLSDAANAPSLVLVVDGADTESMRAELDELASAAFGSNLQLVLAFDKSRVETLTMNTTGRQTTRFGNLAGEPVPVELLDDEEFAAMTQVMGHHRIGFMDGAQRALEYRIPWLVRSVVADVLADEEYTNDKLEARLPSLVGLERLEHARKRFAHDHLLVGRYMTLAEAVIDNLGKRDKSVSFLIASAHAFVCRLETARAHLGEADLQALIEGGYLKHSLLSSGERIVVPQAPELLAVTTSRVLAQRLIEDVGDDVEEATKRLVRTCAHIPAGDVVGARSIVDAAALRGGLPSGVISSLLDSPPHKEELTPGMRVAIPVSGLELDATVDKDGNLLVTGPGGSRHLIELEIDDETLMGGLTSWLILSHVAGAPVCAIREGKEDIVGWLDIDLLVQVGTCPFPLRQPTVGIIDGVRQHDGPGCTIVCHKEGIIEPITFSLMRAMRFDGQRGELLVDEAVQSNNIPLLARLHIALSRLSRISEQDVAGWAAEALEKRVWPALRDTGLLH